MSNKPYTVLAILQAKPGKETELETVLTDLVEPSRREDTCVNYDLHRSVDTPGLFMFYENWLSKEAHAQHSETPHYKAAFRKLETLLLKPAEVSFWGIINESS